VEKREGNDDAPIGEPPKKPRIRRRYALAELLAEMTPDREPPFEDDGPKGEEIV
jgi:hypothetical protein